MRAGRAVLGAAAVSAMGLYAAWAVLRPYQGYTGSEVFVEVRRGAGTLEMAARLEEAGVLAASWPFLAVRAVWPGRTLKAGEYRFDRPVSALEAYRRIAAGDVYYHSFTAPEGHNLFEIAEAAERTGIMTAVEFLEAARQGGRIADLAPGAPSLEGFLFPDTYRLTRHTTAEDLTGQMLRRFREVWSELGGGGDALAAVTLASLVEEETAVEAERPLVASVFQNRLRIGMALQCDPTVIYALQGAGRYRGELARKELGFPSPYNTYTQAGLPPGPISNPGRASLQAALAPPETGYLYFVADRQGGHTFSASLGRHTEAVARHRRSNARRR